MEIPSPFSEAYILPVQMTAADGTPLGDFQCLSLIHIYLPLLRVGAGPGPGHGTVAMPVRGRGRLPPPGMGPAASG